MIQKIKNNQTSKKVIYVGLDQTGAVNPKGIPRPLPACFIQGNTIHLFYLSTFSKKELLNALGSQKAEGPVYICVDCVLGLPLSTKIKWRDALKLIKPDSGYGRKPAKDFFEMIGKGLTPRRKIELLCNANSVFNEKPYQKNIQTGTFRIWKDISQNEFDFYAPTLEKSKTQDQIALFEGYPSFSWKLLFNSNTRKPLELKSLMKQHKGLIWTAQHQALINKDPNLADAFVLALTMKTFYKEAFKIKPQNEGWILGYKND